jgi:hypothetical protein
MFKKVLLVAAALLAVSLVVIGLQPSEVTIKLDFIAPFAASNLTTFKLTPNGDGTSVLWSMTGKNNFMAKGFSLFMDMDRRVGGDFEKGLADLSSKAEAQSSAAR